MPYVRTIDVHAVGLRALLTALETSRVLTEPRIDQWTGFGPEAWPDIDRARPVDSYVGRSNLGSFPIPPSCRLQCHNYYPNGGGLGWHTDSTQPGWRIYLYRYLNGDGLFRYRNQEFREQVVGGYLFETGPDCWHSLASFGERFSVGIQGPYVSLLTLAGE